MLNASPMIWSTAVSRSFRLSIIATAIASLGVLTACSSTPQKASVAKSSVADDELLDAGSVDSLENLLCKLTFLTHTKHKNIGIILLSRAKLRIIQESMALLLDLNEDT